MEAESENGNIEYKLKLLNVDEDRIEKLATQMGFRCDEGEGECIYNIGVEDCGTLSGITEEEFNETISNLNIIAEKKKYSISIISETPVSENKKIYEVLIRRIINNKYIEIKVATCGCPDSGKSSILASLIYGKNDNGRGSIRSLVFNYIHEVKSGRTSSISHQILGFDYEGKIVNYQGINKISWSEIVQKSAKIISFIDLCGHERYLRTTVLGLSSSSPDICMILVDANNGIKPMTKEHIFLCVTLKIPFIIVVSKIDICKTRENVFQDTVKSINKFLNYPGIRRIPLHIKTNDDIILSSKNIHSESITPVFYTSCVTGEGMDNLKLFLNILTKKPVEQKKDLLQIEFHIDHIFNVNGFGTVLGGYLVSGKIKVGDKLLIGPNLGNYENITIRSIYSKKVAVQEINYGSYVCLGIKVSDKNIILRKGNVIISTKDEKIITHKFIAEINVLRTHTTTVKAGYEPMFNAQSIRQTVKIVEISDKKILRNGDISNVSLEFKYRPEYLKKGTRFVLSEGRCKIVGEVL